MPNEGGGNQFGSYELQPGYGDVTRMTRLTKAAPMSGAPVAAQALNTPRRSQKSTQGGGAQEQPAPLPNPEQATMPPDRVYQQIAAIPGASQTVKRLFGGS